MTAQQNISNSKPSFKITDELIKEHGLKPDEYQKILDLIGREPSLTELGIFSAMWNEHCSYKSSKKWLKTLPTHEEWVIQGPGENAGVIDIGDGDAIAFKMESHNHPSFIEPYQGAATGVGGILRDVFTMGARPIATLNALRFGDPSDKRTKHLLSGVVKGIGGDGNSFGVPTVGGEVNFHEAYNNNILVNAMAVGLVKSDGVFYSKAEGVGMPIVYLGAKTGRDGIHGATMASQSFDEDSDEKRPTVQVGDPFTEKCLMEACLELMQSGAVIAIQDMGAAGLTCSAVEMGAKGDLGVELYLEKVPVREEGMTAYEMMLSESQERMLMVLNPEMEKTASAIFKKWDLDFAIVGKTTDDLRFKVYHNNLLEADLPIKELGDEAPEYDRPYVLNNQNVDDSKLYQQASFSDAEILKTAQKLINTSDLCSRRWIYEQYDTLIRGETLIAPGGDAALVKIPDTKKAVALSTDCTPRYCKANPFEGGKQAVAEVYRNISATGAKPLAITDNLNFGNPERVEIMGQFVGAIQGIGEACKTLSFPVVSGNVSLYNETLEKSIPPTPAIGGVGLLSDYTKAQTISFKNEGDLIFVIGATKGHLGQSLFAKYILNSEEGNAPFVDLNLERKHGEFVQHLAQHSLATACHDVADGGLLIAIIEMAMAGKLGCNLKSSSDILSNLDSADNQSKLSQAFWFGEDQARYIVAIPPANKTDFINLAKSNNIEVVQIGEVINNQDITINDASQGLNQFIEGYENWFENYFAN